MSQDSGFLPEELPSVEMAAKSDTILYQMRGLFVGYAGLEYLNRVIQQSFLFDRSKTAELNMRAETLYSSLGRYNLVVETINKDNMERLAKIARGRQFDLLEEITLDLYASSINDEIRRSRKELMSPTEAAKIYLSGKIFKEGDNSKAYKLASKFYSETLKMLGRTFQVEPDARMVAAWWGFHLSLARGYKSAYEALRMLIQDVNQVYGWDFFRISRTDYARHLEDLKYENIRGDQTTSIDAKAILQMIVYGAWNNLGIDDSLPIPVPKRHRALTMSDIFDLAGLVDCLGWLKEFHKVKLERRWEEVHEIFKVLRTEIEGPLMRKFQAQIDAAMTQVEERFKPNLKQLTDYSCVFQINTDYAWTGGALQLNMEFTPFEDYEIAPAHNSSNVTFISGTPGSGKTTLLSALACLSILKAKQVVFIPLSDNFNWPTLAFLPQMEIEGHKRDNPAFYVNKDLGIQPQGVPTIILDIVKDLDELIGVPLTKYDRIVKVDAYSTFKLDMNMVLAELKTVANEFGYSDARGIVAARYLFRKGKTETNDSFNYEITIADTLLTSFLKWRERNVSQPMRVQVDEAAEASTAATPSRAQFLLKQTLEDLIRSARRGNLSVDLATQLASEISGTVRNETVNNFFKNLKETQDKRKSPLDVMLEQLQLDDDMKSAVKMLQRDPNFVNSRTMFWHSSKLQKLNMIYTMPATFMPQVRGVNSEEIYRVYLRRNKELSEDQFLMKEPELWVDLSTNERHGNAEPREKGPF